MSIETKRLFLLWIQFIVIFRLGYYKWINRKSLSKADLHNEVISFEQ